MEQEVHITPEVTEEDILEVAEDILTTHIAAFEELSK